MKMMFRTAILAATLTFPALLAACGSSTTPAVTQTELEAQLIEAQVDQELAVKPALFVGKTSDPNVYVAIVNRNGKIEVYICDGTPTKISVATWFEGTLKDGVLAGTAENGSSPSGTLTGETISGTFKLPNNSSLAFTASRSDQLPANPSFSARVGSSCRTARNVAGPPNNRIRGLRRTSTQRRGQPTTMMWWALVQIQTL
jgi:hypothetical protein